jgi:hypothetical protein
MANQPIRDNDGSYYDNWLDSRLPDVTITAGAFTSMATKVGEVSLRRDIDLYRWLKARQKAYNRLVKEQYRGEKVMVSEVEAIAVHKRIVAQIDKLPYSEGGR